MGLLTSVDNERRDQPLILPLYGARMPTHRDRYRYWAYSQQYTSWKIPVKHENRDCSQDEVGCQEIFDGDTVAVPNYDGVVFRATIYRPQGMDYSPDSL